MYFGSYSRLTNDQARSYSYYDLFTICRSGFLIRRFCRQLSFLALGLILAGCHAQLPPDSSNLNTLLVHSSTDPACKNITHAWGATQLCQPPQRIIALDPHALDLLLCFGIQPIGYAEDGRALVGAPEVGKTVAGVKYLGDRLRQLPIHVGTWEAPSLEAMLRLQPDLILSGYLDPIQYRNVSQIAPTLIPIDDWTSAKQWQQHVRLLGQVLEREATAQQVIATYDRQIQAARAALTAIKPRRVLLLSMTGLDYIGVFNQDTFAGAILIDLGFELVTPAPFQSSYGEIVIGLETLPQLDADLIIVMASGNSRVEQVSQVWTDQPILRSLSAFQNRQVYFVDYQLWSRIQGPIAAGLVIDQVQTMLRTQTGG